MKGQRKTIGAVLMTVMLLVTNVPVALAAEEDVVTFADAHLKQALIDAGAVPDGEGELTKGALALLSGPLDLSDKSIGDLTGLAFASGVSVLDLSGNAISDVTELSEMTSLVSIDLSDNELHDIDALFDLDNPPETLILASLDVRENYLNIAEGSDDRKVINALTEMSCYVVYTPQNEVAVTGVDISQADAELCPGETVTLTASVLPEDASKKTVTWQSSKPAVATVSNGIVTAVSKGTATITVTTQDGSFTDTCDVTVKDAALASSTYFIGGPAVRGVPELTDTADFKSGFANGSADVHLYSGSSEYTGSDVMTGLTVKLVVGDIVRDIRTVVVEGDINGDGKVTVDDYTRLKLHLLGKKTLDFPYIDAGDFNRDGQLTVADYVRMRLHILGFGDIGGPLPGNLPVVSDSRIRKFLDIALAQLGKPYVWGAEGPDSFDCSGFIYYCLNKAGYSVGRSSANSYSKYSKWDYVNKNELKPGDLMFYVSDSDPSSIGHVGIYLGNGYHVHASSDYGCIIICGVEGWYERSLSHGRRVFK